MIAHSDVVESGAHVLVDTNVIIEAHRTRCWRALVGHYLLDTVSKCVEECRTGNQRVRNPVPIDIDALEKKLKPKPVSDQEIAPLVLAFPQARDLDDGERYLLAYAFSIPDECFLLCSPDRACLSVIYAMGWIERYVSLEELAVEAGVKPGLRFHYTKEWVEQRRTDLMLENYGE